MLQRLKDLVKKAFSLRYEPASHSASLLVYKVRIYKNRHDAEDAAAQQQIVAVVQMGKSKKWVVLKCPCGCRDTLALNLMQSHQPAWRLTVERFGKASLFPSVHASSCGAHFWLKKGRIIWCD